MVSRNNQWYKLQQGMEQVPHFGIRKLTVGVSSVLLGLSFMGINMTTVHADTATPAMTSASQVAAQGTTTTANTGEKANPETAQSTDENAKQHLSDTLKLAQEAGVNVTKSGTKVINGTNANDAENQAALDYQGQNEQVKKAFDEQQKANTQSQDEYNKALEAYKQALKDKGYPVKDGALTGNDIQQNLIFGDEPNVVVNGTVTDNRLMIDTGNDINYKHPTFPSQGNYHEIVFKDGNSTAVERELGEFTFTNLQNSYYEGRKISMYADANVWSVIISIIAAVMAGYAFWKSTGFKEKDYRCLNLYEQYAGSIGKCIAEDTPENRREYKINYCRLYVYIDPLLKAQMETIDESMANNELDDVNSGLQELSKLYNEVYNISQFSPRRKAQKGKPFIQININK